MYFEEESGFNGGQSEESMKRFKNGPDNLMVEFALIGAVAFICIILFMIYIRLAKNEVNSFQLTLGCLVLFSLFISFSILLGYPKRVFYEESYSFDSKSFKEPDGYQEGIEEKKWVLKTYLTSKSMYFLFVLLNLQ